MSDTRDLRPGARRVSATEAAKNLGSILAEVRERGAEYVVEHRGKAVAQVGPAREPGPTLGEFARLVAARSGPRLDEECLRAIEEGIAIWNREEVPGRSWER